MGRLSKKIEDMLSAAAFAEAGEFDTARELIKGRKRILLVLTGATSDSKAFIYAMNVAQRIGARLEILIFDKRNSSENMIPYYQELLYQNGLECNIRKVTKGCIKTEILQYTTKESGIQFVVAESLELLNSNCQQEDRSLRGALKRLRCPLVLVSELEGA